MTTLIKPIVTEKMTAMADKSRYAFIVNDTANKIEIKKAVEKQYGVSVTDVNTQRYNGKIKKRNTKAGLLIGRVKKAKKAIVTLKSGDVIDFYASI